MPRHQRGGPSAAASIRLVFLLVAAAAAGALQELDWFHEGLFEPEDAQRAVHARHHWSRMLDLKLEEMINRLGFEPPGNECAPARLPVLLFQELGTYCISRRPA